MSQSFTVDIRDRTTPALKRQLDACNASRLNAHIGPRLVKLTQDHFLKLPHNKRGWKPQNFWAGAARSTNWQARPEGLVISANQIGVRQRFHGGPIEPVNAGALTIPMDEQAYGKTAADFGDRLQLIVIKDKGAYLVLKPEKSTTGKRGRKKGASETPVKDRLKFLFKLCAGVKQHADKNVLPTNEEYLNEAIAGATEAVK